MFPLFKHDWTEWHRIPYGWGKTPDSCKKLIKERFNRGGITTSPLVLQQERPRTAGGMLISPQTLCFSSLVWIPQKSLTVLSWLWGSLFLKEPAVVCVMRLTSMSVSFCVWVTISEKKTFKGKSSHFWLVPSWGMPPLLIILGPVPSSVGVSVGSKDICYESPSRLVFRADLTAGLQIEMSRFVSIIFTLWVSAENRVFVHNKWSKFRGTALRFSSRSTITGGELGTLVLHAAWRSVEILSQNVKLRLWFPETKSAREQGERGAAAALWYSALSKMIALFRTFK